MATDASTVSPQHLKQIRESQGLSIRELSERSGIAPSSISQIETGRRKAQVKTKKALANALGVSVSELDGNYVLLGLDNPAEAQIFNLELEVETWRLASVFTDVYKGYRRAGLPSRMARVQAVTELLEVEEDG